ncbi:hypothetical protein [Herbaspirillum sp.]|uniref:hypothetical protein n=1 Tax=Herbaspirillum sp. TaxID=1890675 RepID=UPI0031D2E1EF
MSDLPPFSFTSGDAGQPGAVLPLSGRRHILQTLTPLYVLVRAAAPDQAQARCQVLCERLAGAAAGMAATHATSVTNAMVVYLSPFDACIDAAWNALAAERYEVLAASAFRPDELLTQYREQLPYCLHVAWCAHDGRLLVRPDGGLLRLSLARSARVSALIDAIHLAIEMPVLESCQQLWEQAGLFAHEESHAQVLACHAAERHRQALRAIERIPGTATPDHPVNQLALYDVESAHWHFVALPRFADILRQRHPDR